jgi:hypothetical protein
MFLTILIILMAEDYKTLFITVETSLYSVRVKIPGAKPKGAQWAKQ